MKRNKKVQEKISGLLEEKPANMEVKILNIRDGLKKYENVQSIRINSKKERLIIMQDYMPIIGEVDGEVIIETKGDIVKFSNIVGYYMNYKNQFNLFLKEE